jgi:hypothetical protein
MSKYLAICKIRSASINARKRANIRWSKDRAMRDRLAEMEPSQFSGRIVRRIVVIENESAAREIIFYDFDTYTDRKRKLNQARALAIP